MFKPFMPFTSRKFLLTVAGLYLVIQLPAHADKIIQVIGVYIGAEGVADVVDRYRGRVLEQTESPSIEEGVDTSTLVTGTGIAPNVQDEVVED